MILFLLYSFLSVNIQTGCGSIFGPVYPITASLFCDREVESEWNTTLDQFKKQGGDTVWLQAPPIVRRTKSDLQKDAVFKWCKENDEQTNEMVDCFQKAEDELTAKGMRIISFASYQNEEDYSDIIIKCPQYDKKIVTDNTYFRIVLPANKDSSVCGYNGMDVVVLFTSFSGSDSHKILLQSATSRNFSVYIGMPRVPRTWGLGDFDNALMPAYYEWVKRIVGDHKSRYSNSHVSFNQNSSNPKRPIRVSLYNALAGYYVSDDVNMGVITGPCDILTLYSTLSGIVKNETTKKVAIAPATDTRKFGLNRTIQDHMKGFEFLINTTVDVIAVHEGRGYGKGAYYWPTQENLPINSLDPILDKILHTNEQNWKVNGTFSEAFTGSVHELFRGLSNVTSRLSSTKFGLWLALEAFDDLKDDPCLPLGSPVDADTMDTVNKSRIDRALAHGASTVRKVVAFSWDPDFTCTTKLHSKPLSEEIVKDAKQPIILDCFFHSTYNRSVVVIGVNLYEGTQGFNMDWPDRDGHRHTSFVYGYYYELDYGGEHGLIPSIEYIMMHDPYDVINLSDKGYVRIKAVPSYSECIFLYDYSHLPKQIKRN